MHPHEHHHEQIPALTFLLASASDMPLVVLLCMLCALRQEVKDLCSSTHQIAPVPSKSYISYMPSTEAESQLQRMQSMRRRESSRAWEGVPAPDMARSILQRMSSNKLRRLESMLQRASTLNAPAQVSCSVLRPCLSTAR